MKQKTYIQLLTTMFMMITFLGTVNSQTINFNYICPLPGSEYINPEQTIILKTGITFDGSCKNDINTSITGSKSGNIDYSIYISEDKKTIVLTPTKHFHYNETITVKTGTGFYTENGNIINPETFVFNTVTTDTRKFRKSFVENMQNEENSIIPHPELKRDNIMSRDNNLPADFPAPYTFLYEDINDDYFFLTLNPRAGINDYDHYLSIIDKYGTPVFFRKTEHNHLNFHQMSDGRLASAKNYYNTPEYERYFFMDSSYVVVDSIKTGNGYDMDGHDILLLENGNYLLISYDPQPVDMSLVVENGDPNAIVTGLVIQEITPKEIVLFQWRSWDHFEITDATSDIILTATLIDYVHGNAVAIDLDGNILLSSRHLDEITKINFQTGDIIYRLGKLSENNEFNIIGDSWGFSHQHDVRVLSNGHITVYDNGNLHTAQFSRVVEYEVDQINKTATQVWEFRNDPDIYAPSTGSYRTYPDGNKLVGWGSSSTVGATQLSANDDIQLEILFPDVTISYRTLKSFWRTNIFVAPEEMHFGNYNGNYSPKQVIIPVTNNSEKFIQITSAHLMTEFFEVTSNFPVMIQPGETVDIHAAFLPNQEGLTTDILTLNYDKFSFDGIERIARQVELKGIWNNEFPTVTFVPEFAATNVSPTTEINIFFSEPIQKSNGQPIENVDIPDLINLKTTNQYGDIISFDGVITDNNMQITIFPDSTLEEEQQYYVELIPNTIKDLQGITISYPETTVFTTGKMVNTNELYTANNIIAFPVPTKDVLNVATNNNSKLLLYNSNGKIIIEQNTTSGITTIETKNLVKGIYIVVIINSEGDISKRNIVKM